MIVKHKRTGGLYKVLHKSYSVERQRISIVYVQLETGYVFDRDLDAFTQNFEYIDMEPQMSIVPKEPHK